MKEIKYFYPLDEKLQGHIVWVPYGDFATTLCKIKIRAGDLNFAGEFGTERKELQPLCKKCRTRLTRARSDERRKLARDLDLLRKWDPQHRYLGEE